MCDNCAALTAENKELKEERDVYLKCILSMDKEWRRLLDLLEKFRNTACPIEDARGDD
jgi:hypothetical protein